MSQRLAFTSLSDVSTNIYIAYYDGATLEEVAGCQTYSLSGQWSPDGNEIVIISSETQQESNFDVYALNVNTKEIQRITDNTFFDAVAKWITW